MLSKTNLKKRTIKKLEFSKKSFLLFLFACILLYCFASCSNETKNVQNETKNLQNDTKNVQIGDYITFGRYEQDNNTSNGKEDIEWLVLDVQGDKALVISKYALDCQPYNTEYTDVTWETCTLRKWLNVEFLYSAFSSSEIDRIPTVTVSADANPYYDTDPGNATQDKVFLLSITEAGKYFSSDSDRECKATAYAVAQGARASSSDTYEGNCWWWLRSPGYYRRNAAFVYNGGCVYEGGYDVSSDYIAVRPALWIDLNS